MAFHLERGEGLTGCVQEGVQQLLWLPARGRGTGLASMSLPEPSGLSLPLALLPKTCSAPRQAGPGAPWQGHWESLQLVPWLRNLSS